MISQVDLAKDVAAQFRQGISEAKGDETKIQSITETALEIIKDLSRESSCPEQLEIKKIETQMFRAKAVQYKTFPIIGDGNCCFRSMSHSLARTVHENNTLLKDLKAQRDLLKNSRKNVADDLTKIITLLEKCKGSPDLTEKDSNDLTALLRKLSCTWNEGLDVKTWNLPPDHVKKMKKDKEWGTAIEIQAIVSSMGIRAKIICIGENGRDDSLSTQGEKGPVAMTVAFQGNHYFEAKLLT